MYSASAISTALWPSKWMWRLASGKRCFPPSPWSFECISSKLTAWCGSEKFTLQKAFYSTDTALVNYRTEQKTILQLNEPLLFLKSFPCPPLCSWPQHVHRFLMNLQQCKVDVLLPGSTAHSLEQGKLGRVTDHSHHMWVSWQFYNLKRYKKYRNKNIN